MKKSKVSAAVFAAAVMSTMIGCGEKNVDQSVPDTVIEVIETNATITTETTTNEKETTTNTTNDTINTTNSNQAVTGVTTTGTSSGNGTTVTTAKTTIRYAGNAGATVRQTAAPAPVTTKVTVATTPEIIVTTVPEATEPPTEPTDAPTEPPTEPTNEPLVQPDGTFSDRDMSFTVDGATVMLGGDYTAFFDAMLGNGMAYQEVQSCIQGESPFGYAFDNFEIHGDGTTTKAIIIFANGVTTEKGIGIGSSMDDVFLAYGTDCETDADIEGRTILRYNLDETQRLELTFDGNGVCYIRYNMD